MGSFLATQGRTEMTDKNQTPPPKMTGLLRLKDILAPRGPIPVSKSTWWAGVKTGRYPSPIKLGERITAWRAEDINALIERGT
jgi:prophage regulatory protein